MARILEGRNSASADSMADFVKRIENLEAEKLREKMTYMERARRITEQQKEIYDEAKDEGVSKKALRAVVKVRDHERKAEGLREDLEDDDAASFDDIRSALGDYADTPLGAAAVGKDDDRTSAVVKAVRDDLTDDEKSKMH